MTDEQKVEEHEGFKAGEKVRVIADDEESGIFAGDEGVLSFEKVGAKEYGNERIAAAIKTEHMVDEVEVSLDNVEAVS